MCDPLTPGFPTPGWLRYAALPALAALVLVPPAVLARPAWAEPTEVRLARDGRPAHPVVVSGNASPAVRAAAADLADTLGRIAAARFHVVAGDGTEGIAVGTAADFPALADVVASAAFAPEDPLRRDEYLLRTHDRGVWLVGASQTGVQHAVWDCLRRLGYRLFFPTDTWEVVPARADLRLALDLVARPDYIVRRAPHGAAWSHHERWQRWRARNRVASDFSLATSHAYDTIVRTHAAAFRDHPEYLALVAGERRRADAPERHAGLKFCISNPGLRRLVVEYALDRMRATPDTPSISLDPSDGGHWCECEPCRRMGSVTDRVVLLANEVAEAINGLGLGDKYVGIYAYGAHSPPPAVEVHPRVVVSLATSFIREGWSIDELFTGWSAKARLLGVREYHSVFPWSHDLPRKARGGNPAYLAETIPRFHARGARFMISENSDSWGADGLGFWLSTLLLWDVSEAQRVDEHVEDFLEKAFGDAREPMREFYRSTALERSRPATDLVGRMYRHLGDARGLTTDAAVRARLDDLLLYTRYVELYERYRGLAGEARQAAFERLWRHVYRIRDRMLVSAVAVCHRDRFRDPTVRVPAEAAWSIPEPDNPWKDSRPFGQDELERLLHDGIAANAVREIGFEPVVFSADLVPAAPLRLAEPVPGVVSFRGRGRRRFHLWVERPGPIELVVTGGLIAHYRDRGNVAITLASPLEETLEPVAQDRSVPPDGAPRRVTLRTPHAGLHTLDIDDGHDLTEVVFPAGLPVTIVAGIEDPPPRLSKRWTLGFYVPRGTTAVGGYAADCSGRLRDGAGAVRLDFSALGGPGYFQVEVPAGQDGRMWSFEQCAGARLLMTVPPCLAATAADLLLPREVVEADRPSQAP